MLELKRVNKIYNRNDIEAYTAVDNVSLDVKHGDFIGIIGKSGSGKSTLLNMIVGLLHPSSGEILFNGENLWMMDDNGMANIRNSKIGYVPQGINLLSNLTILDNVRLPFFLFPREGNGIERAMDLLNKLEINNLSNKYPAQLSGGEMRRVAIARALINEPEILIADEPTGDLDDATTRDVMNLFAEINKYGVTVLMVTHENDITAYFNKIYTMSRGKLNPIDS